MKKTLSLSLLIASLAFASSAFAGGAVVVNSGNGASLDQPALSSVLVGKQKFWEGGAQVVIAILKSDKDADAKLKDITGMDGSRFKNHWQRLAFSGRGQMPKQFNDTASLIDFVKSNDGAIAIVPDSADISSVKKLN